MSIFRKAASVLSDLLSAWTGGVSPLYLLGGSTFAGEDVTPDTALQCNAVWAANKILGEGIGTLPVELSTLDKSGSRFLALDDPRYWMLRRQPNPDMTAADFFTAQTVRLGIFGNSYSLIARDKKRMPIALWPLYPELMQVKRTDDGELLYDYIDGKGTKFEYPASDILHVRTMSMDGIRGLSPISYCRNSIGIARALERYAGTFFASGGIPGATLSYPGQLSEDAQKRIRASWEETFGGVPGKFKMAVLEEGLKFDVVGINPKDSQAVESRRFQLAEVARIYRIPPHMLADLERATFSNIEHLGLEFVMFTLRPWLEYWEQALMRSLFTVEERGSMLINFDDSALLRGDIESRYAAYAIARQWGWMSANDIRRLERMNVIEGGDVYLSPMNMIDAGNPPQVPPSKSRLKLLKEALQGGILDA